MRVCSKERGRETTTTLLKFECLACCIKTGGPVMCYASLPRFAACRPVDDTTGAPRFAVRIAAHAMCARGTVVPMVPCPVLTAPLPCTMYRGSSLSRFNLQPQPRRGTRSVVAHPHPTQAHTCFPVAPMTTPLPESMRDVRWPRGTGEMCRYIYLGMKKIMCFPRLAVSPIYSGLLRSSTKNYSPEYGNMYSYPDVV